MGALLALATLAVFWPVAHHDFIYLDDPHYVRDNSYVHKGLSWQTVAWAFSTGFGGNWHPLTWLSHAFDCQVFGVKAGDHHVVNLLFHTVNVLLLFALLKRMTKAFWRSALVAALFAWHPLHVESVAWIAERKDVLSTCFGLLSLWAYACFVEKSGVQDSKSRTWYGVSLVCFACGLMSKPMLVTWPFVLLLLDYWPLNRLAEDGVPKPGIQSRAWKSLVVEKIPFFAVSAAASAVTFLVQRHEGAMSTLMHVTFGPRLANAVISYLRYVQKTFWPVDLAVFYPHPATVASAAGHSSGLELAIATLLLVGVSILAWIWRRRRPYLAFGWFWFLGTLVPVIGLVQVGMQAMADRYSYIPLIGLFISMSWWLGEVAKPSSPRSLWVGTAAGTVLFVLAFLCNQQVRLWKDTLTLFGHALTVTPSNATAQFNYGAALHLQGDPVRAMEHYRLAIAADPSFANAHYNLAQALAKQGNTAEAEAEYRATLKSQPDLVECLNNFALFLHAAGKLEEAESHYQAALRLRPGEPIPHANLGRLYFDQGRFNEAVAQYREALRLQPDALDLRAKLGFALAGANQLADAEAEFREAIRRAPAKFQGQLDLGNFFAENGQPGQAAICYAEALRLEPDLFERLLRTGSALLEQRQPRSAVELLRSATRLQPDSLEAQRQLGLACALARRAAESERAFRRVLELAPDARTHVLLGRALLQQGKAVEATSEYEMAVKMSPDFPMALNELAWLRATHPEVAIRDGAQAVRLAERASALEAEDPRCWDTLAAAYAEAGRYADALKAEAQALRLAQAAGQTNLMAKFKAASELYEKQQPYREKIP